jgi:hypothetical protein
MKLYSIIRILLLILFTVALCFYAIAKVQDKPFHHTESSVGRPHVENL